MKVIKAYPPNFTLLARRFPIKGKQGILYSYGDRLYNPSGIAITPWIQAHEATHMGRQQHGVEAWWNDYINSDKFRLEEELLAHRAEWHAFQNHWHNPKEEARYLERIAERLSSPLYGNLVTHGQAVLLILGEA